MIVEFQLRADRFAAVLAGRVALAFPCLPVFSSPTGETLVIDRVDLLTGTHFERRAWGVGAPAPDATIVQLVQPMRVVAATLSEYIDSSPNRPADGQLLKLDADLLFALTVDSQANLVITFDQLRAPGIPAPQVAFVQGLLSGVPPVSFPVPLAPLQDFLGSAPFAFGAVCADTGFKRLAIVLDFGTGSDLLDQTGWKPHLTGNLANYLDMTVTVTHYTDYLGKTHAVTKSYTYEDVHLDWSARVDQRFITRKAKAAVSDALKDVDQLDVGSVSVNWNEQYQEKRPEIHIGISGVVHNVGVFSQDVDVSIGVRTLIELLDGPKLRTAGSVAYTSDTGGAYGAMLVLAVFVGAFVGLIPGAAAAAVPAMIAGAVLGSISAAMITTVQTIVKTAAAFAQVQSPGALGADWDCTNPDDRTSICTQDVAPISLGDLGKLATTSLLGNNGLLVGGSWEGWTTAVPTLELTELNPIPFNWTVLNLCESPNIAAVGGITVTATGDLPFQICGVEVIEELDDAKQFVDATPSIQVYTYAGGGSADITYTFSASDIKRGYRTEGSYPLALLVRTNAGARVVMVPGIPDVSPDELQAELTKAIMTIPIVCNPLIAADSWWSLTGRFNPKWSVDPPIDQGKPIYAYWWRIQLVGLHPNERFGIEDSQGGIVMEQKADVRGFVSLEVVTSSREPQWTFTHEASRDTQTPAGIHIEQLLLRRAATINVDSTVAKVAVQKVDGTWYLAAETRRDIRVYKLTDIRSPNLLSLYDRSIGEGLRAHPEGFAVIAPDGFRYLPIGGTSAPPQASAQATKRRPVMSRSQWFDGVAQVGRFLARPTGSSIELWAVDASKAAQHFVGTAEARFDRST